MEVALQGLELIRFITNEIESRSDIINLTTGELPFSPPRTINDRLRKAVFEDQKDSKKNPHAYTDPAGSIYLRRAIAELYRETYSVKFKSGDNVLVTHGATQAIWLTICVLSDYGDEVLIPDPSYFVFEAIVTSLGRVPVRIKSLYDSADHLEASVTSSTKIIILNSPGNPTGELVGRNAMEQIHRVAGEKSIYILHDEVYDSFIYEGSHICSLEIDAKLKNTVIINSASKKFGMGGWRIGWLISNEKFVLKAKELQSLINMSECSIIQDAVADALTNVSVKCELSERSGKLKQVGRIVTEALKKYGLVDQSTEAPKSGFYLFAKVEDLYDSIIARYVHTDASVGEVVSYFLIKEYGIAVGPGISFGKEGSSYIRMSIAVTDEVLKNLLDRVEKTNRLKHRDCKMEKV